MKYQILLFSSLLFLSQSICAMDAMIPAPQQEKKITQENLRILYKLKTLLLYHLPRDVKIQIAQTALPHIDLNEVRRFIVPFEIPLRRSQRSRNLFSDEAKKEIASLLNSYAQSEYARTHTEMVPQGLDQLQQQRRLLNQIDPVSPPSGARQRSQSLMRSQQELGFSKLQQLQVPQALAESLSSQNSNESIVSNLEEKLAPLVLRFGIKIIEDQLSTDHQATLRAVKSASPRLQNAQERYEQSQTLQALRGRSSTSGLESMKQSVPTLMALPADQRNAHSARTTLHSSPVQRRNSLLEAARPQSPLRHSSDAADAAQIKKP